LERVQIMIKYTYEVRATLYHVPVLVLEAEPSKSEASRGIISWMTQISHKIVSSNDVVMN